jgi:hypothetical protein
VDVIRAAHARLDAAGIGGPIEPPPGGRAFGWAVYFLRYSAYLGVRAESAVGDLAGDNASYKREALRAVAAGGDGEFWEQEAHRRLLARGERLVLVPAMRVQQAVAPPPLVFLRQRVRHGRRFGAERARRHGRAWAAAAACASPLVPPVLMGKVIARVVAAGGPVSRLLICLPWLAACAAAWAIGEASGYSSVATGRDAARG